ncbi:MAG: hypothetical protein K9J81_10510 [Desulfohalobiaceae bacterium]|nr:hypothetical protein [Desulfohalobiaceae bacterium]
MDNPNAQSHSLPESLVSAWMKSSLDFWQTLARNWTGSLQTEGASSQGKEPQSLPGSLAAFLDMFSAVNSALIESGVLDSCLKDMGKCPDISMKFGQLYFDRMFKQIQECMVGFQEEETTSAEKEDGDLFESYRQAYAQSLHKIFNLPQLGLTRSYQERVNEALDQFNQFCIAATRFLMQLRGPVERSWIELQNKIAEMSEGEEEYPDNPEEYYKLWIRFMEGDYLNLFKTQEFVDAFHQMVNHYTDFQGAQQKVLSDVLQFFPVSTKEELDEVARENYLLKKEVKKLVKRVEELEKDSATSSSASK